MSSHTFHPDVHEHGLADGRRLCSVDGCSARHLAQGLCNRHYKRLCVYGATELPERPTLRERFTSKVEVRSSDECWPWLGCRTAEGYGRIGIGSYREGSQRTVNAHRVAYLLAGREIPVGYHVDHLCRNTGCCNPAHLEAVTPRENQRRGIKGVLTTHCPHGHEYNEANTYSCRGRRECRACGLEAYHRNAQDPEFRAMRATRERERRRRIRDGALLSS